jgi:hypothetical protein
MNVIEGKNYTYTHRWDCHDAAKIDVAKKGRGGLDGGIFPLLTKASQHGPYTANLNGNHDSVTSFTNSMQGHKR